MEKYLFMRGVLKWLAQDRFLCRSVAIGLKVGAAMIVLFSLTTFFSAGRLIFDLSANGIPGGALFELFYVLAVYAAAHTLLLRSHDADAVRPGEFIALRLAPVVIRGLAEAYAAFVALVAIGGGLFVWFTNLGVEKVLDPVTRWFFPTVRENPSFMGGIEFMVSGVVTAFAVLLAAYAVAELLQFATRSIRPAEPVRNGAEDRLRARFGS